MTPNRRVRAAAAAQKQAPDPPHMVLAVQLEPLLHRPPPRRTRLASPVRIGPDETIRWLRVRLLCKSMAGSCGLVRREKRKEFAL